MGTGVLGDSHDAIIQIDPTGFVRSGTYNYNSGGVAARGQNGYGWVSVVRSETAATQLYFSQTYINPTDGYDKGNGYPLRCLVR